MLPKVEVVPTGQEAQVDERVMSSATAPARAYLPAGQPAVRAAVHVATVRPSVEPYLPAWQGVHVADPAREYVPYPHRPEHWSVVPEPNRPAAQSLHVVDPADEYVPDKQLAQTLSLDTSAEVAPRTARLPAGHKTTPEHLLEERPDVDPYVPAGQGVHLNELSSE